MKKIIGILLTGLLGFLGCSDSNDTTMTVGQATPVAPFNIVETPRPTYEWTPVQWATKYRLVVQNTNEASTIQDEQETYIIDEWYAPEEADCTSEENLCMVTPEIEVIGENEFKILACVNEECGLWSDTLTFDFTALNGPRFTDNNDGTVRDNNTQLLWTKNAMLDDSMSTYDEAIDFCYKTPVPGYGHWRLPSLPELRSLVDTSQMGPALPVGNPFINVDGVYWSTTPCTSDPVWHDFVWCVEFITGGAAGTDKSMSLNVWCVRTDEQ